MSESRIETMKGMCAVDITKYLMKKLGLTADGAYARFMQMELYALLMDTETGMFLEQNEFLFECCDKELECGVDALYEYLAA